MVFVFIMLLFLSEHDCRRFSLLVTETRAVSTPTQPANMMTGKTSALQKVLDSMFIQFIQLIKQQINE